MDLARITWFTLATAMAATAVMIPPGLFLAWLLARRLPAGVRLTPADELAAGSPG